MSFTYYHVLHTFCHIYILQILLYSRKVPSCTWAATGTWRTAELVMAPRHWQEEDWVPPETRQSIKWLPQLRQMPIHHPCYRYNTTGFDYHTTLRMPIMSLHGRHRTQSVNDVTARADLAGDYCSFKDLWASGELKIIHFLCLFCRGLVDCWFPLAARRVTNTRHSFCCPQTFVSTDSLYTGYKTQAFRPEANQQRFGMASR